MGEVHNVVADVSTQTRIAFRGAEPLLSEFECAQIRRLVADSADMAAAVVLWHRETVSKGPIFLEERLGQGMAVAALGALIMQLLAWVRLMEPLNVPVETLRLAHDVLEAPNPQVNRVMLCPSALELLDRALTLKETGRRISRNW